MKLKPSTYQKYFGFCKNHIFPIMGNIRMTHLTTAQIQTFAIDRLKYGLKPQSINSILVFLHSMLKYGHRQYRFPFPDVIYLSTERKEMRVFTPKEQHTFVSFLLEDIDIYKLGVLLALFTGVRIGELCALHWEDIKEDSIYIRRTMQRIQNKDGKGTQLYIGDPKTKTSVRTIPLPSFLAKYIQDFRDDTQQYFLGTPEKPIIEPRVMQYKFEKYIAAAKIEKANFHALRHSFATRCVECGFEIKTLSEILGHANVQITLNRYVHSSMELKRNNMEKLTLFW